MKHKNRNIVNTFLLCSCGTRRAHKITNRRRCIYCGAQHVHLKKKKNKKGGYIKYWQCYHCNRMFRLKQNKRKKDKLIFKILTLYKTKKEYINKFDNKKKETYSTRDIALLLNISKTKVAYIIKHYHIKRRKVMRINTFK